jgi:hypothetical protein
MTEHLDPFMLKQRRDAGWLLEGLGAKGPVGPLRERLQLFGQFVGDWEIFPGQAAHDPGLRREPTGEVHWRWVLGGLGVQDVWGHIDPGSKRLVPQGSTLRFFDPGLQAWRSTWIAPYQRKVRKFIGRQEGSEIVLREKNRGWKGEHWIFSKITHNSFRWRAETRFSSRGTWTIIQQYWIRRVR